MLRYMRMAVSLLLVFALCLGSCGCSYFVTFPQSNGATFPAENPTGTPQPDGTILMDNGVVYHPYTLPNDIKVLQRYSEYYPIVGLVYFDGTKDGTLLYSSTSDKLYCREDYMEELTEIVESDSLFTEYCLTDPLHPDASYLTKDEIEAVEYILTGESAATEDYQVHTWLNIYKANTEHTFGKSTGVAIGYDDGTYYLYDYGSDENATHRYTIPFNVYETIKEAYHKYPFAFEENDEEKTAS